MTIDPVHSDMYETDFTVDIDPVFKQNWKTGEARDYWEPVLEPFDTIDAEIRVKETALEEHPREGGFIVCYLDDLSEVLSWLSEEQIKFQKCHNITIGGHDDSVSDRNTELAPGGNADVRADQVQMASIAFGNSQEVLDDLSEFSENIIDSDDMTYIHVAWGAAFEKLIMVDGFEKVAPHFGIPECCIEFTSSLDTDSGHTHPLYEIACNTPSAAKRDGNPEDIIIEDGNPMLNIFWSYLNFSFIDYYPCSFECEASHDVAVARGKILRELGHDNSAELLHKWLSLPLTWTGVNGIGELRNAYAIGAFVTSDYWDKKKIVWGKDHKAKPELSSVQLPVRDW